MLRLGRLTDYGIVLLAQLAGEPTRTQAVAELASATRISPPTVAKLLKAFTRDGLVCSTRGASGGYRLGAPAESIALVRIVTVVEGRPALTACAHGDCHLHPAHSCRVRDPLTRLNRALESLLADLSLADLMAPPAGPPAYSRLTLTPLRDAPSPAPASASAPAPVLPASKPTP